jgi:hypothetical protein
MTVTQENVRQHEIGMDQWASFIDAFVHAHEEQAATMEIFSATGSLLESRSGQLRGLKLDSRRDIQRAFLELHQPMHGNIAYVIACPVRMIVREGDSHKELEITSGDGRKTLLQLETRD